MAKQDLNELRKLLAELNTLRVQFNKNPLGENGLGKGLKSVKAMTREIENFKRELADLENGFGGIEESIKNIVREWKPGFADPTKEATKSFTKLKSIASKLSDDINEISVLNEKQLKDTKSQIQSEIKKIGLIQKELKLKKSRLKVGEKLSEEEETILANLNSEFKVQEDLLKQTEERLGLEQKINKAMGLTGAAFKGIKGALGKIGIEGKFFDDVEANMREAAKSGSKMKTAFAGVKGLAKGIGQALSDPLVVITLLVKSVKFLASIFTGMRKSAAEIGAQIGGSGQSIYNQLDKAGNAAGDMYNTTEELKKAYLALNDAAGRNLATDTKRAKTFNEMVQYLGFSVEQAKAFANISMVTGDSMGNMNEDMENVVNSLDAATGTSVQMSDVIENISGASASTRRSFQGNFKAMVATAHTAARLGVSMDQIANAARKTLDFQSSIENEMEVEMMLGRSINLEKLRHATLTRDAATMAEEQRRLVKETMADTAGNQILLEQTAALLGMSVDEYESIAENIEKESKMTGQQLLQQKKNLAAQKEEAKQSQAFDRSMQAAMNKLKSTLKPLAESIMPHIITGIEKVTAFLGSHMGKVLLSFAGIAAGIGIAKSLANKFTGGMFERGATPMNPQYVYNVNESGGGMDLDMSRMIRGNVFKYLGRKGGLSRTLNRTFIKYLGKNKLTKGIQTITNFTGSKLNNPLSKGLNNILGRITPNSGANLMRNFGTNNMAKINQMAQTGRYAKGTVIDGVNVGGRFMSAQTTSKAAGTASKFIQPGSKIAQGLSVGSKGLTMASRVLGKVAAPLAIADLVLGGYTGAQQADMSAEEQKAAGVRVGMGKVEGIAKGVLTGGAERGSMVSDFVGIEKGSAADDAMGILGAGARGAAIGATIGSIIPGIGTAVGAAVGGIVGTVSEGFKVFTDPDSKLRQGVVDFAKSTGETLSNWAGEAKEGFMKFTSAAGDTISAFAEDATEVASSAWSATKSIASSAWSGTKDLASSAWSGITSFFARGGVAPGGFRAFANGGMVTSPTLGMVGEGGMNEAIVPLPDGRSIPVQMGGGGEVATLLKQLISIVSQGGDVYLDGNKVGQALALGTSRMG